MIAGAAEPNQILVVHRLLKCARFAASDLRLTGRREYFGTLGTGRNGALDHDKARSCLSLLGAGTLHGRARASRPGGCCG
jgi:hypothetical protein